MLRLKMYLTTTILLIPLNRIRSAQILRDREIMATNQLQILFKSNQSTASLLMSWQKSMSPMIILIASFKRQMPVSCKFHLISTNPTKIVSVKRILRYLKNLTLA